MICKEIRKNKNSIFIKIECGGGFISSLEKKSLEEEVKKFSEINVDLTGCDHILSSVLSFVFSLIMMIEKNSEKNLNIFLKKGKLSSILYNTIRNLQENKNISVVIN